MRRYGPEKEFTEPYILSWAERNGFDLTIVDSSAVYSQKAKRYLHSQTSEPLSDLIGNYKSLSVWIELKAPKKRYDLSTDQRDFLIRKINQGCFACVTDSVEHLSKLWSSYLSSENKKQLLLDDLPLSKKRSWNQL